MAIALIVITGVAGYLIYHARIVGLVLSLPDSNEDFVYTGVHPVAESASLWSIPPKELGNVPCGDSPHPAI